MKDVAANARRFRLFAAFAAIVGTAAAALVCEASLRVLSPQPLGLSYLSRDGITLHIPNARVRYRRSEFDHVIAINSLGLRDREIARKAPGEFRILTLGDSFAEGKQVALEETFPKRLESLLRQRFPARAWEVVNGGVSGYGTADEIKFFEIVGRALEPDLVILAFCVGNDVEDNRHTRYFGWDGSALEERPIEPPARYALALERLREFAASHSHLYQFLRFRTYFLRLRSPFGSHGIRPPGRRRGVATTEDWRLTDALIARLQELVTAAGAKFVIVAIPFRAQVLDDPLGNGRGGETQERGAAQRHLADFAAARGIPFVDLAPPLRAEGLRRRPYFQIDGHFNAIGHSVAAEQIFNALEADGLIPADFGSPAPRLPPRAS